MMCLSFVAFFGGAVMASSVAAQEAPAAVPVETDAEDGVSRARRWAALQNQEAWMTRPDVIDTDAAVIVFRAGLGVIVTDDPFGARALGSGGGPVPASGGLAVGLGYRIGPVALLAEVGWTYTWQPWENSIVPSRLDAHALSLGGGVRLFALTGSRIMPLFDLGAGAHSWFSPFIVDASGQPERVSFVWAPFVRGAFGVALGGFVVGGESSLSLEWASDGGRALSGAHLYLGGSIGGAVELR